MPRFPAIFRALQKNAFQHALKTQCLFQHVHKNAGFPAIFWRFQENSCLPKRSENFKVSPKIPCFPAIFALSKKNVFSETL